VIYAAVVRTLQAHNPRSAGQDARDVTQEVFLRLIRNDYRLLRQYDPARSSLVTWLTVVAHSMALDHLRRRRLAEEPIEGHQHRLAAPAEPPASGPPTAPVPEGLLSPRQKLVLHLLFDEEMSVSQVAEALGVEEQTVRSTKHKAIEQLRKHLRPGGAEE
jgi:RNA polymerase sigma-70 factor (ECF subfamily)